MGESWGLQELPLYPFAAHAYGGRATSKECLEFTMHEYREMVATGVCPSCGGKSVPAEEMFNGWSMHSRRCAFTLLGTVRVNELLKEMGWE